METLRKRFGQEVDQSCLKAIPDPSVLNPVFNNMLTRWYPRGIQKLVSTYELPETHGGGGGR